MYSDRVQPHNSEAEDSVLGSLLLDGDSLTKVSSFLKSEDFFYERNKLCYEACINLISRNEAINQITVAHELRISGQLDLIGGMERLNELPDVVPTPAHIIHYAEIVHRTAVMRKLISTSNSIAEIGFESSPDMDDSLSKAEELLFQVRSDRGSRDFSSLSEVLDVFLEETTQGPDINSLAPVASGFNQFDEILGGGLQRSDLVIIAARPSLGKSSLAFNIAANAALQGNHVGIFSLEMSKEQIAVRLLSSESGVDSSRLRLSVVNDSEMQKVFESIGTLSEIPLYIDDTPFQTIVEMRSKARRLQAELGLDLLIVDYLQLINGNGDYRSGNRVQEMGEISRSLKGIARDLNVPVIACSQLSRAIEQRPDHRPLLSDLRERGSIEQDADIVSFIHREDRYIDEETWEKKNPGQAYPENIAEIIIAKHRNGRTGNIKLFFQENLVKFENLAYYPQN